MLKTLKEVKVIKGDSLPHKHLKARMLNMEKTLKNIRRARKSAESDLHQLQRALNLPLSPVVQISAPPSRSAKRDKINSSSNDTKVIRKSGSAPVIKSARSSQKVGSQNKKIK